MHLNADGSITCSPTDLITYLEGDFAAWCERVLAERNAGSRHLGAVDPVIQRDEDDPQLKLVAAKGLEHEDNHLVGLRGQASGVVELTRDHSPADTLTAMRTGAPVIFQARLAHGAWQGYPDFLYRVDGDSELGPYHYEPWDTKLARSPKPYFLTQLCAYADLLEQVQGRRPQSLVIVLGNDEQRRFATGDYFFHFLQLRDSFLAFQAAWSPDRMPDPGLDRGWGRWSTAAGKLLEGSDHLRGVAGITRGQIGHFEDAGITTMAALAASDGDEVPHISGPVRRRLRTQTALQIQSREAARPLWELCPRSEADPRRGLALLPPPSPLDVFFDMEGFPFAEGGLEYLFGVSALESGSPAFRDWWAHGDIEEKRAFEGFIDFVIARWRQDPAMHVYHYASYERSALRRLMGKYATREAEVDDLLRYDVLVDLYAVVRQGLIVGAPSYSLKDIERLYLQPRAGTVTSADGSLVEYQRWLDSGEPGAWEQSPILRAIRDYNRVDCESTWQLREWLLARQAEAGIEYVPEQNGGPVSVGTADTDQPPSPAEMLAAALLRRVTDGSEPDPERRRVTELLVWLVEFHRREERPMWWRMFERHELPEEELRNDFDCLAGLTRTGKPPTVVKQSFAYEYAFDPEQETRLSAGSKCFVAGHPEYGVEILAFDADAGLLELKPGKKAVPPPRLSLIPDEHVRAVVIKDAVLRFAQSWADGRAHQCVEDLLFRRPPRIRGHGPGPLIDPAADLLPQVLSIAGRLEGTTLCIQGPPGTGKTFTAAAVIADLLRQGRRVGITANSHKVILNLMGAVVKALDGSGSVPMYKVGSDDDDLQFAGGTITPLESKDVAGALGTGAVLVGGTAWVFSRPELAGCFDYLFIDEAGQVSLANAVAMGLSATNLVLVGDQMQLGQPTQGSHPGESGRSCLVYALDGHATIPPHFGIFLETSWRMHPDVCRFISDAIYDGRLTSRPHTASQAIAGARPGGLVPRETGIVFIPVEHDACTQWSDDEVEVIGRVVQELGERTVVDRDGRSHPLTLADVLFVAPFNMQVRRLRERFGGEARVGSVDKFQGQEAPVVIVSLCASTLEEAPRGAEFLLDRNRLNVAVSRAQALAIVVASPALLAARCGSIEEMALVNVLCRLARH